MLHHYVDKKNRILLVDDAKIELDHYDRELDLRFEHCRLPDVVHLGGGIYDAIVFPTRPPDGVLKKAFEKVYWGGVIIIQGIEQIIEDIRCQVLRGSPGTLALRRPPAPPDWSREHFLAFQPKGKYWDAKTKSAHLSYKERFKNIDVDWKDKVVAEYGCGRGEITRLIAKAGAKRVYAIDSSAAACDLASEFCCPDSPNVTICQADALEWEAPGRVDIIVAIEFVEHLFEQDLQKLIIVWYDSLKSGGLVHIVTPLGPDAVRDHKWTPSPKKLKEKMERVGFTYKRHVRPEDSRKFFAEFTR